MWWRKARDGRMFGRPASLFAPVATPARAARKITLVSGRELTDINLARLCSEYLIWELRFYKSIPPVEGTTQTSNLEETLNFLRGAIADGGRTARDGVAAEARNSDEIELTFWCYSALSAWGQEGLDLIAKIAMGGHTVKGKSAALTLFTALAVTGQLPEGGYLTIPTELAELVNHQIDQKEIKSAARHALRLLVLSLPTNDLLLPVSQSVMHLQLVDGELVKELVSSLSTRWLRFGPPSLDRYEQLLIEKPADESIFQAFFCEYPQLLDPMAVQVWSQPDFHGALEPDFVVRRADNSYLVIEIECPNKQLVTMRGRVSQAATHAETQALEYEDFLSARIPEARAYFPNYHRADCLAVVGLERALSSSQIQGLDRANSRKHNSRIVGFDWLLERARTVVSNVGDGRINVVKRHRVI